MRLKSLELTGFKSFADKTKFDFHEGVTAIVGPNGCGKSNVVDAVRWALGETSAKALRGGEMADVIFNGSDKRKPLSMAEVVLTFTDCAEKMGTDFDEISVARRVFRDGKGEYDMNGNPCRLKDIHKLFMDTGVGRTAYSIMEQGKIDMLLSAKPEDRRVVFEEAAGITKSKGEKREALRKLEYTEANLLRVTDILTEMKRQMASSQRQAAKARRYQEMHRDARVLDTHLHFRKYSEFSTERAELETSVESLRIRQEELEESIRDDEAALTQDRAELRELDTQIGNMRHQMQEQQTIVQTSESRIGFNEERRAELTKLTAQNEHDIETNRSRMALSEEELRTADEALAGIRDNLERQKAQIEEQTRVTMAAREEKARIERAIRDARIAINNAEGVIISAQAEISSFQQQCETDRSRQDQLQREMDNVTMERDARGAVESETKARAEELHAEIESLEIALHASEKALQAHEIDLERLQKRLNETTRLHSDRASRAEVLRNLLAQGEGLERGTQAALQGVGDESLKADIRGLLSNFLEVEDRRCIGAIEAALGGNLSGVVVSGSQAAEQVVDALKRTNSGEAVLFPQDIIRATAEHQIMTMPEGGIAWALDKVKTKDGVRPLVQHLLSNVLLVADLKTALALRRENPEIAFATLEGEFVSAEGAIRGGTAAERKASMLQRQAELQELDAEVARLEAELQQIESERETVLESLRSGKLMLDEQREVLQQRRVAESTLTGQLTLMARELQTYASKLEAMQWEQTELLKRQEAAMRRIEESTARRAHAEEEVEQRRAEASEGEARLDSASHAEQDASELLNEFRTALAVEQRAEQAIQEQRIPILNRLRELEEVIARRECEIENYRERITAAAEENEQLHEQIASARSRAEELMTMAQYSLDQRNEKFESVSAREGIISNARRQISAFAEQRGREEIRTTQLQLRMEALQTYAMERYQVDLERFEQDVHALTTTIGWLQDPKSRPKSAFETGKAESAEAAAQAEETAAESTTPEAGAEAEAPDAAATEAEAADGEAVPAAEEEEEYFDISFRSAEREEEEDEPVAIAAPEPEPEPAIPDISEIPIDWDFVELHCAELKQRLDSMGPVNLDAIQEYEELEERHNFLQREFDDLNNAKIELLAIIQRINDEAKKRFAETFYQVRDNFRNTFRELFGAQGHADLILANEEDPLESGIEIIAKPPGKKPTSITLLSGGERSMTAVALLFSIYMVKPSPFCILDELDAPLDESNIGRFLKMLDRFIEKSQFVIVTHNKRTMRRADVLYGVTMEEFGVSKPIGMQMSEGDGSSRRSSSAATRTGEWMNSMSEDLAAGEAPVEEAEAEEEVADAGGYK